MLRSYTKPQDVSINTSWTKIEDVFDYIEQNNLDKVYFSTFDSAVGGMQKKDFQIFSRELFNAVMKLAYSKYRYDSGEFEEIEMEYNSHKYKIKVFESYPSPNCLNDTLYTIEIYA